MPPLLHIAAHTATNSITSCIITSTVFPPPIPPDPRGGEAVGQPVRQHLHLAIGRGARIGHQPVLVREGSGGLAEDMDERALVRCGGEGHVRAEERSDLGAGIVRPSTSLRMRRSWNAITHVPHPERSRRTHNADASIS